MKRIVLPAVLSAAALALTTALPAHAAPEPGELTSQDIATAGDGSPVYRIPALTRTNDGTLLAAYDARPSSADLPSNIGVVLRRSTDGGDTWQDQQVIRKEDAPKGNGDPSLLVDRETGRIFAFYSATVNQGFFGSHTGNDENDPDVQQTDYSYSDDDGKTWKHRRITGQIKKPEWAGMFAASGEGIQLKHGQYAGRLIQQYAIRKDGQNYAVSAYSDDHGETWKIGEPVGPGGDENKTVELSDGRIMLNNRAKPYRQVAYSSDGGVTYSAFEQDEELPDPANNGSIIRYDADADASDPKSEWLLFSNTANSSDRSGLTVKMSCDNGETWPVQKTIDSGSAAYSTLTKVSDDRVGMLYERGNVDHITYKSFDLKWLGGTCADITVTPPDTLKAGTSGEMTVRVVNKMDVARAAGTMKLDVPSGWSTEQVSVPALKAGEGANVTVPLTPAADASGDSKLTARYTSGEGYHASAARTVTVTE